MKPTTKHKGVVFEVDSFGDELLTNHTLSAAYLLASAARQMIIPEHGRAGSIGAGREASGERG
jgi:hypothetical protein